MPSSTEFKSPNSSESVDGNDNEKPMTLVHSKLPYFDPGIKDPGYDDMVNLKNYKNLSLKDKFAMIKYKYFDGEMPLFIRVQLLNLKRKVFVQQPLPENLVKQQGDSIVPRQQYPRNKIRTTKYTPVNFVPKNLFYQFQNAANGYFLFCVILGAFQIFGVSSPALNAVPLIVIVFLTAVRDAFEDSRRTISDTELNNSPIHLVTGLVNPNVVVDNVGPWRKFKKANTKFFRRLFLVHIFPFFKRMFGKKSSASRDVDDNELAEMRRESLGTIDTSAYSATEAEGSVFNHRLSMQSSRFLNAPSKVSPVEPHSISNPEIEPSGNVKFRNKSWKDIYVGDIVRVRQNEEVPADLVILSTSHEDQNCYIETKNLDGETNLKLRQAVSCGGKVKYGNDLERVQCWIECDAPNPNLYSFTGAIHYSDYELGKESVDPVTIDNVLLRGTTLRNTKWVIGIVLYTGIETKIMLNSGITPSKRSRIAEELNLSVYINFGLLFVLCFVSGVINGVFYNTKDNSRHFYELKPYVNKSSSSGVIAFFVALILYQSLVPISLYISVEIIKTVQAFFIWSDVKMYYDKLDYPCHPNSWNISDDVGQVEYIFSDKTGTLTQNVMEFKKCSVGLKSYGMCYTEAKMGMQKRQGIDVASEKVKMDRIIAQDKQEMAQLYTQNSKFFTGDNHNTYLANANDEVSFVSSQYLLDVLKPGAQKRLNEWFMTALALCHTAVTEDAGFIKAIKAESPDEQALVGVARDVGIEFRGRKRDTVDLTRYGIEHTYRVLSVIPFNSTRKRMSVVVEVPRSHLPGGAGSDTAIVVITKGADNVIYERLRNDSNSEVVNKTALYLEQFSKEGLRTLCFAYKELSRQDYEKWAEEYHEANVSVRDDREDQIDAVSEKIEHGFTLLGTTAIEDRLQDGVPDSIALLSQAGIKLWVLTGDKTETAINIGFSCNLLGSDMKLLVINEDSIDATLTQYLLELGIDVQTPEALEHEIARAKSDHGVPDGGYAVIVDGAVLTTIFDDLSPALKLKFLLLCKNCRSVLCCRVAPAQKAQVVAATKSTFNVMTLAIGDGANDVAMIQAANIGVGLAGEEGRQAVMSSDYGLGQFRFLTRLVLVHGRWSYKRLAEMIPCFFYKNVVFTLTLFWYGIYVNFDGTYLFEFTLIMFYNLAFTSLPIIFLAVLDQDVGDNVSLLVPELYRSGILGLEWSQYKFILYMLDGLYQSVISFYFPYLLYYTGQFVTANGLVLHHRFWMGTMVSSISVFSCNIYVLLQQKRWDWLSGIIYAFSVLLIFFWVGVWSSAVYSGEYYKAAPQVFGTLSYWAVFFVGVVTNLMPRFVFDTIRRIYFPRDIDIIRERAAMGLYNKSLPESIDPQAAELSTSIDQEAEIENTVTENSIINNNPSKEETQKQDQVGELTKFVKHPIGSIKRKLSLSRSPLEVMRRNMIRSGEVDSHSITSSREVPGLSQAASLVSVRSRMERIA